MARLLEKDDVVEILEIEPLPEETDPRLFAKRLAKVEAQVEKLLEASTKKATPKS